jgi:hypothetical protein
VRVDLHTLDVPPLGRRRFTRVEALAGGLAYRFESEAEQAWLLERRAPPPMPAGPSAYPEEQALRALELPAWARLVEDLTDDRAHTCLRLEPGRDLEALGRFLAERDAGELFRFAAAGDEVGLGPLRAGDFLDVLVDLDALLGPGDRTITPRFRARLVTALALRAPGDAALVAGARLFLDTVAARYGDDDLRALVEAIAALFADEPERREAAGALRLALAQAVPAHAEAARRALAPELVPPRRRRPRTPPPPEAFRPRVCVSCGQRYTWLNPDDPASAREDWALWNPPGRYREEGAEDHCLGCWLGVGPRDIAAIEREIASGALDELDRQAREEEAEQPADRPPRGGERR